MRRSVFGRAASLLRVLRRDPGEFADRVGAIVAGRVEPLRARRPAYEAPGWAEFIAALPAAARAGFEAALVEPQLAEVEAIVTERGARLSQGPIDQRHNGDLHLARCCYACVRWLRPTQVVETGVANGVTSAFILAALAANRAGTLHSVDLPPHESGADEDVGAFVPDELRARWRVHRGLAQRVLPAIFEELGGVDMFVHDSLHTYSNMRMEFDRVWPQLAAGGVLIADDIEGNGAFLELRQRQPQHWAVCREASKPALFGLVIR